MLQRRPTRFAVLANVRSGAAFASRHRRFARLVDEVLGADCAAIESVEPHDLPAALDRVAKLRPEALILLGGDGTARSSIERLTPEQIPVAPLAGGALSRISRTVYGTQTFRDILQSLAKGAPSDIPAGTVNGRRFYCAAGCGAPLQLAALREAMRARDPATAIAHFARLHGKLFSGRLDFDGASGSVALAAPGPIDAAFGLGAQLSTKPAAPDQKGEVAIADFTSLKQAMQVWPDVLAGSWREVRGIVTKRADRAILRGLHGPMTILVDGEALPPAETAAFELASGAGLIWRGAAVAA